MATMLNGTALVLLLLFVLSPHYAAALYAPTECCLHHAKRPVRLANLQSFYETSTECPVSAIVFVTVTAEKICADPEKSWVKRATNVLGRKK